MQWSLLLSVQPSERELPLILTPFKNAEWLTTLISVYQNFKQNKQKTAAKNFPSSARPLLHIIITTITTTNIHLVSKWTEYIPHNHQKYNKTKH